VGAEGDEGTRSYAGVDGVRHELLTETGDDNISGRRRELGEVGDGFGFWLFMVVDMNEAEDWHFVDIDIFLVVPVPGYLGGPEWRVNVSCHYCAKKNPSLGLCAFPKGVCRVCCRPGHFHLVVAPFIPWG
jgi:hypothetical protein